jgi:hypothetical protein
LSLALRLYREGIMYSEATYLQLLFMVQFIMD